jgi:hypothetical protein
MIAGLDRDTIARGRRREQALDALEFERERERELTAQIEQLVVESEGARIDAEAFSRLDPEDVELVRGILEGHSLEGEEEPFFGDDGLIDLEPADEDDAENEDEIEIERLGAEVESCRRLQVALERYVAALDAAG